MQGEQYAKFQANKIPYAFALSEFYFIFVLAIDYIKSKDL